MHVGVYLAISSVITPLHLPKLHFHMHFFVLNNQLYSYILDFALDTFVCPGLEHTHVMGHCTFINKVYGLLGIVTWVG